jgi:DNA-binding response OmpR family regulator
MSAPALPRNLFVVDDDEDLRDTMREALQAAGFEVQESGDGATALAQLQRGAEPPDMILLDLVLPDCDGFDFRARQLADARLAAIPVLVLSGARDVRAIAAALRVTGYLQKPFTARRLLEVIDQHWPRAG